MQCKCSRTSLKLAAHCATFVALVAALPAHAQQFVLVDQTYTATAENTDESHFVAELKSGIPANFVTPTNYSNGRLHVELEVLEAPSATKTLYNICLHNSSNYACLPYVEYTGEGTYEADPVFNTIWNHGEVDWTQGVSKVELILKNEGEQLVHGNADFYPYRAHLKLYVIAEGSRFDPTMENTTAPEAGTGGTPPSAGRGGATAQAGEPGTGGRSSAAGRSGSSANPNPNPNQGGTSGSAGPAGNPSGRGGASGMAGAAGRPAQPTATAGRAGSAGTAGVRSAVNVVDAGADTAESRSISAQLENTSGCSVTALGANRAFAAWPMLALGLLAVRRRRRGVPSGCHN
jgi:MYXO-CTERM domain-containing protein